MFTLFRAYEVLSDSVKRQQYDQPNPFGGAGNFDGGNPSGGFRQQGGNPFEDIADLFRRSGFSGFNPQGFRQQ